MPRNHPTRGIGFKSYATKRCERKTASRFAKPLNEELAGLYLAANPVNRNATVTYGCRSLTVLDAAGLFFDIRRTTAATTATAITEVAAGALTASLTAAATAAIVAAAAATATLGMIVTASGFAAAATLTERSRLTGAARTRATGTGATCASGLLGTAATTT
jgi:hypothetical protein